MEKDKYFLQIKKSDIGKVITTRKDYIVYKVLQGGIAQLLIPKGTRIVVNEHYGNYNKLMGTYAKKLRSNKAIVLAIIPAYMTLAGKKYVEIYSADKVFVSKYDYNFEYRMGKIVIPNYFNSNPKDDCGSGIHFFATLEEAEMLAGF